MSIVIGLDIGTSKICALAFDTATRDITAVRAVANDADISGLPIDRHEQNPGRIIELCCQVIRELVSNSQISADEVVGIGISGQMHGVLVTDAQGNPQTHLVTWRDQRAFTQSQTGNLSQHNPLDQQVAARTGCHLHPGYGGATLWWFGKNKGFAPNAKALTIADTVAAAFSGRVATEPTHAASWGIYNLKTMQWDQEVIKKLGLSCSLFAEVLPSARPLGTLRPEVADLLGLPQEVQVCSPVGDNQASVIGATGIPDLAGQGSGDSMAGMDSMTADSVGVVNLGTGGQVSVPRQDYTFVQNLETRPMPFGGYILVGASICGGWSYSYLRSFYQKVAMEFGGVDLSNEQVFAKMYELAAAANEDADGLLADTRFLGTRGDPEVRGRIYQIDAVNLTPANLTRAVIEGMIGELADFAYSAGLESIKRIVASGNAVRKNPLVKKTIERLFNLPCEIGEVEEEAARGAALASAAGLGLLQAT
ncbi:MAG: hypothetical protein JXA52_07985 [Planctomycetes bacterium]|nr:hypothetical protein [Planctomycetota bacterium]